MEERGRLEEKRLGRRHGFRSLALSRPRGLPRALLTPGAPTSIAAAVAATGTCHKPRAVLSFAMPPLDSLFPAPCIMSTFLAIRNPFRDRTSEPGPASCLSRGTRDAQDGDQSTMQPQALPAPCNPASPRRGTEDPKTRERGRRQRHATTSPRLRSPVMMTVVVAKKAADRLIFMRWLSGPPTSGNRDE